MTPTRAQILACITDHPGMTTLEIVSIFADRCNNDEFNRTYHCVRVKLSALADRGDIWRSSRDMPRSGPAAEWYPGAVQ